jgi:hypothetical protein
MSRHIFFHCLCGNRINRYNVKDAEVVECESCGKKIRLVYNGAYDTYE